MLINLHTRADPDVFNNISMDLEIILYYYNCREPDVPSIVYVSRDWGHGFYDPYPCYIR